MQIDDLIQAGVLGLLEASERYDATQGASFSTFAGIRIRGAMLDEIRRGDWTPRSVHRKSRAVAEAQHRIESRLGRQPTDEEIAHELDMSLDEYRRCVSDAASAYLFSLDEHNEDWPPTDVAAPDSMHPLDAVEWANFHQALAEANEALPERERLLITLYYDQDLNLRQIAERLGVSESRACQIHGRALSRVREQLSAWTAA